MPVKPFGVYTLLSFDSRRARADVDAAFREILVKAVKAWISAARDIIPVYSGASLATIVEFAALVNVDIAIVPTENAEKYVGDGTFKGLAETPTPRLITVSGRYGYFWTTNLAHLRLNETTHVTTAHFKRAEFLKEPTPYRFREVAEGAFIAEMNRGIKKFDLDFIINRHIKVKKERI